MRTQVHVPVEIGARRRVKLPVLGEAACRSCGETILRVNGDDWIHEARVRGRPCAHTARPSANTAAKVTHA